MELPELNSGAYCLLMHLNEDRTIKIGKLGTFNFPEGYYIYVGSAMKNLRQRIERHLRDKKKLKWHIDYFLQYTNINRIIVFSSKKPLEEKIASLFELEVKKHHADIIVKRFGSTDTKNKTHLFFFSSKELMEKSVSNVRKEIKKI